ncbi:MAG: pantoate--beta-alanine ligase [Pseudomonadota bacterium]
MQEKTVIARSLNTLRKTLESDRFKGRSIGFVPTMGALHDGHLSLVDLAQADTEISVVSIFVNPTQFAPGEDLDAYPRTEAADIARLEGAGVDVIYIPKHDDMYPSGSLTDVSVAGMSDLLDGVHRPHFFYGVATVVARLFIHVRPDVAVFGEKDYQQLQIIRRMVRDLGFQIDIIGGPTVRDPDGLAQSSRNAYLTIDERKLANTISTALHRVAKRLEVGANVSDALTEAKDSIRKAGFEKIDYVSAVDSATLQDLGDGPIDQGYEGRLLAAAWMGKTRLIDNIGFVRKR